MLVPRPVPATGQPPPSMYHADIPPIIATPLGCIAWLLGSGAWNNCDRLSFRLLHRFPLNAYPGVPLFLRLQPLPHPPGRRQHHPLQAVHIFTTPQYADLVQDALFQFFHSSVEGQGLSPHQYRVICNHSPLMWKYIEDHRQLHEGSISAFKARRRVKPLSPPPILTAVPHGFPQSPLVCIAWLLGSGTWTNVVDISRKVSGHLKSGVPVIPLLLPFTQPHSSAVHIFTTPQHATLVHAALVEVFHSKPDRQHLSPHQYRAIRTDSCLTQGYIGYHRKIQRDSISVPTVLPGVRFHPIQRIMTEALRGLSKPYFFVDLCPHIPGGVVITFARDHKHLQPHIAQALEALSQQRLQDKAALAARKLQPLPTSPHSPLPPPLASPSMVTADRPVLVSIPTVHSLGPFCQWTPSVFPSEVDWTYLLAAPTNIFQWKPTKPITKSPPTHLNQRRWLMSLLRQHQATAWDINSYPRLWRLAGHGSAC